MKKVILPILLMLLPILAYSSVEGIYQVQPESYRTSGETKTYGKPFEITIFNNGDGTYYVDDLLGGWYSQRQGYGKNYAMTGNIEIEKDGTVTLIDSYIEGWSEGVKRLTGAYDATNSTFRIEVAYADFYFVQTWVKINDFYSGGDTNIEKDGIYYKLNSQEQKAAVAFNPKLYKGDLIIPEMIEYEGVGYNVTAIADSAFYLCRNLLSLEIPNSITTIGSSSFNGCESLASIIIPNSVTDIGNNAFYQCRILSSVNLPDQLKRISIKVFEGCSALTSIIIPDNVTSIGDGAFYGCTNLATISFPNGLTNIGDYAFYDCHSLSSLSLPNSLRAISASAFEYCNFSSIELPNGLTIIGPRVFYGNYDLSYVSIPPSLVEIGDQAFDVNTLTLDISDVSAWCKVKINSEICNGSYKLYLNGNEINDLIIPNEVKTIESKTFRGCSTIASLTIPNSVVEISDSAFYGCTNLKTVFIQSRLDSIGNYTFYKCASLESVTIPDEVELIGERAFYECERLNSISLPANLKSIGNNAFFNCKDIPELKIPESVTTIGYGAFSGCDGLKSLIIPATLTSIGNAAFSGCNGLTSITVDNGNMVYDSRDNCNAIIETATNTLLIGCNYSTIPNSIQFIGGSAFYGCKELKTIKIPETVKEIGGYAFSGCGLTSIILPNSITSISYGLFQSCSSLSSIEIPNSVKDIGNWAFANCKSLSSLTIPNSVNYIGSNAFEQCMGLLSINIPNSVTSIGSWAFYACHSLKKVSISNGIKEIGYCFNYCIKLETLIIPRSVKKITSRAFEGCYNLNNVYCFADEVPEMGSDAIIFPVTDNNTTLHVPANSIEKYKKAYIWSKFANIVALTDEELAMYNANNPEIAVSIVSNSIEGIYITQPDSYRIRQGNNQPYGNSYEITIIDNSDGTYFVDDLLGGWYCQRAGYGSNYSMTGNIEITTNGIVSLKDSYAKGWGDSLLGLTGNYDSEKKTFAIEADYVEGMHFHQTWVKVGDIFTVDGINYSMDENNTVSVRRGKKSYSGDIIIPENVSYNGETYTVTSIGIAFSGCENLKSVTIPNSVKSINGAFSGCENLKSVTIPNSVKSISGAFNGCTALKSINIPNSVTTIENNDFLNCTSLETVDIPNSVTSIGEWSFLGCTSLSSIKIPRSVVSIGEGAFMDCANLADIAFSDGLITIGNGAFSYINLKSLTIPKSVLRIGDIAFSPVGALESIRVDNENAKYDSRGNCNAIIEKYTNRLILGCKNTIIPQNVKIIGRNAFYECNDLVSLDIPSSVTSIERGAFSGCTGLSSIILDNNIREIEDFAFSGCNRVKLIIIPQNVNAVNWRTFQQCYDLKDFYCYAETYPATDAEAFFETPIENATLHVPANLIDTYRYTAPWSGFGKIVALTDNDPKPTSVRILKADETVSPVATYSIDGRRLSQPKRGLNIIRMSDGTTKKMMIKP